MTSFVLSLRSLFRILRFLKQRLKALLGCLWLSWSRFLREVKRVTQHVLIGAEDEAKDGDQGSSGQSSLPKASPGSYKGDGVICASSIPASLSEPDLRRSTPDSDDASGFISLRPLVSRSPSAPEFTVNVPQDSPRADSPQLLLDSPRRVDSPYRAETPFDSDRPRANNPLTIVELRTPRVLTPHPRTTSRQFSGVPSRASSRSPSPFRRRSSVFRTSKRHGSTSQLSNSEGTHTPPVRTGVTGALPARPESPGSPTLDIYIQPPSRPGTPGSSQHTQPSYHSRHSLQHGSSSSLVMQTEILDSLSISSSAASRRSRHRSGSPQGPIPQNVGHGDPQATFSTQQDPDTFPFPQASPATNGYRITGTRYMQPMHSDQVSRYVRKYDV
ncbi:hypothetical protein BC834DRAFT_309653 [Gloeopeniophorella convolvens]|nr:hypothetical protein BC834DRAFT_309653 [Gloeopeniophorella convolvens]